MSVLKVRLNKLSTDWHTARALLEDEYKVYLDKALDRVRTRYEFASHLLDVHRMWCAECSLSGCPAQPVRSERDTCAPRSASGKQAGFQLGARDMGIHDHQCAVNGIKQEHHDNESSQAKANNKEQREEGTDEAWLDQIPHSHRADVQSLLDRIDHVSDIHILIKEEVPYQEYYDVKMESSRNQSSSHQGHEECIITQHSRSDVKTILENDSEPPRSSYHTKEYSQETSVQAQCDAGIGEPSTSAHGINEQSPEDSAQDQCNTGGKTILEIESKSGPSRCTYNAKKHGPEVSVQAQCDASIGEPSCSAYGRSPEDTSQDECNTDGKTFLENNSGPPRCTYATKEHGPDASVQAQCDAGVGEPSSSAHGRNPEDTSQDECNTDGNAILKDNRESYRLSHNTKKCEVASIQTPCGGSMGEPPSSADERNGNSLENIEPSRTSDECGPVASVQAQCNASTSEPLSSAHDGNEESHKDSSLDLCDAGNPSKERLASVCHAARNTEDKLYQCSVCRRFFRSKSNLTVHMRTHTGQKPYQCSVCNKAFSNSGNLSSHMRTHTGQKTYQCSLCNKAFKRKSHLTLHMRTHTGEKPYECSVCNKAFSDSSNLSSLTRIHTGFNPYHCSVCNKSFPDSSHRTTHMRTHTGQKPYQCSLCDKAFKRKSHLTLHLRTHTGEKPYECSVCNKSFSDSSHRTTHMRTHTGQKHYQCSVCNKAFTRNDHLTLHMRTHTEEKPFPCSVCHKFFSDKSNLSRHMRTHTGDKPYQCSVCDKAFSFSSNLLRHVSTHTGELSYQCCVCNKSFSDNASHNRHMRKHNGEKPFQCSICNKAFSLSSSLSRHMRIHTDESHHCSVCHKSFLDSSNLTTHMTTHTGDKPYKCSICNKAFSSSSYLSRHMTTHRGKKP